MGIENAETPRVSRYSDLVDGGADVFVVSGSRLDEITSYDAMELVKAACPNQERCRAGALVAGNEVRLSCSPELYYCESDRLLRTARQIAEQIAKI